MQKNTLCFFRSIMSSIKKECVCWLCVGEKGDGVGVFN